MIGTRNHRTMYQKRKFDKALKAKIQCKKEMKITQTAVSPVQILETSEASGRSPPAPVPVPSPHYSKHPRHFIPLNENNYSRGKTSVSPTPVMPSYSSPRPRDALSALPVSMIPPIHTRPRTSTSVVPPGEVSPVTGSNFRFTTPPNASVCACTLHHHLPTSLSSIVPPRRPRSESHAGSFLGRLRRELNSWSVQPSYETRRELEVIARWHDSTPRFH